MANTATPAAATRGAAAWSFLDERFIAPARVDLPTSWAGAEAMCAALVAREATRLARIFVAELDEKLRDAGQDPLRDDWRKFRPLAGAREETWSDWLAWSFELGPPDFRLRLFDKLNMPADEFTVEREAVSWVDENDLAKGNWRSDLIIAWERTVLHVEVKTGDLQLDKTWGEAKHLRTKDPSRDWHHYLLLLPEQVRAFENCQSRHQDAPRVDLLTWDDVELALRRSLLDGSGTPSWRAMARTFAGAVGQLLLRRPVLQRGQVSNNP